MPVVNYGDESALSGNSATELDSMATGEAHAFGRVTATGAEDYLVHLEFPRATAATIGSSYDIYLLDSLDDSGWSISSPSATNDLLNYLATDKLLVQVDRGATFATAATDTFNFSLKTYASSDVVPPYFGFVLYNGTNAVATVGFDASVMPIRTATGLEGRVLTRA